MPHTLIQVATALGLQVPERFANMEVRTLLTDSRSLCAPGTSMFFALHSDRADGHRYIAELYRRGVRMFVVENLPAEASQMPDAIWLPVPDTLTALQKAGALGRPLAARVLAITGSRGKTSLKEWLFQLLSRHMSVSRSPRSYNSQIGVPLSLWETPPGTDLAIIEAGISKSGEMSALRDCIRPDIVLLTNLGQEHSEGFSSMVQKGVEKLQLACQPPTRLLVMPADSRLDEATGILGLSVPILKWSLDSEETTGCRLRLRCVDNNGEIRMEYEWDGMPEIAGSWPACSGSFPLPEASEEETDNAASAMAYLLGSGVGPAPLEEGGTALHHVMTRLDVTEGVNGCSVIADSYTSDFGSLRPAVDFMKRRQTPGQSLTLVLSDLIHESRPVEETYANVAHLCSEAGIDRFIGVGPNLKKFAELFPQGSLFFHSTDRFMEHLSTSDFSHEAILLKGAPEFEFGRIKEMLELRTHETVLEVNLGAIMENYNYFRSKLPQGTGIVAMVKASGYGAGSLEIARTLQDCGAAYLAVAVLDEGIDLREHGITMPIMVMNPKVVNYRQMFAHKLEPEIYSLEMLEDVVREGAKCGVANYPVHLKLDTGMHRMGLTEEELPRAMQILNSQSHIELSSVFSHLATADCPDMDDYTRLQLDRFKRYTDLLASRSRRPFKRHILNSAGILRFPEYAYDMVRLGIGLYGVNTLPPEIEKPLAPVSTLRTVIIQLRKWKQGESIGYARRTILKRDSMIATLPIGYADGMNRHFGNGAVTVLVNGHEAPTAGNICMDACMIDVTGIDCKVGDAVEIFGPEAPISRLAETLETIPYEILTSVSPRVKRIYYRE